MGLGHHSLLAEEKLIPWLFVQEAGSKGLRKSSDKEQGADGWKVSQVRFGKLKKTWAWPQSCLLHPSKGSEPLLPRQQWRQWFVSHLTIMGYY